MTAPNYTPAAVPVGTSRYPRAFQLIINNPLGAQPGLVVREETAVTFPDGSSATSNLPVTINTPYSSQIAATNFQMRDPATDELTGASMTYAQAEAVIYSMTRDQQTQRDAAAAPTNLTVTPGAEGSGTVTLNWTPAPNFPQTFCVLQGTSSGEETVVQSNVAGTSATITGLTLGAQYFFTVQCFNQGWVSNASTEVSVTPS